MFTWLDLLAPWGICLLSAGLCVWGAVAADTVAGTGICLGVGALFLSGIGGWYLIRWLGQRCDFQTALGVRVCVAPSLRDKILRFDLGCWIADVIKCWSKKWATISIEKACKETIVIFRDTEKIALTWTDRYVRGYTDGKTIVVGWNGELAYAESLFKHELGHVIMTQHNIDYDETVQHALAKDVGCE